MVCKTCLQYRPPNPPPPSTLQKSLRFNETLSIDVFTWHVDDVSIPVVVLLDEATKFVQAREMKKNYTTRDLTDMIEETWISWAGMPEKLRLDEDGPHTANELQDWTDLWCIYP